MGTRVPSPTKRNSEPKPKPKPKPAKRKAPSEPIISVEAIRLRCILGAAVLVPNSGISNPKFQVVHIRQEKTHLEVVSTNGHWMFVWREERAGTPTFVTVSTTVAEMMIHMATQQHDEMAPIIIRPNHGVFDCEFGRINAPHVSESDNIFKERKYLGIVNLGKVDRGGREVIGVSSHYIGYVAKAMSLAADDMRGGSVEMRFSFGTKDDSVVVVTSPKAPCATVYLMPMRI